MRGTIVKQGEISQLNLDTEHLEGSSKHMRERGGSTSSCIGPDYKCRLPPCAKHGMVLQDPNGQGYSVPQEVEMHAINLVVIIVGSKVKGTCGRALVLVSREPFQMSRCSSVSRIQRPIDCQILPQNGQDQHEDVCLLGAIELQVL